MFFGVTFLKSEYVIMNGRMDSIGIDVEDIFYLVKTYIRKYVQKW